MLYLAKHLGRNGEIINVPKIRTMYSDADSRLEEVIKRNGFSDYDNKPNDDPRIVPSRKWLRKLFFDELPQIPYNLIWKRNFRFVGVRSKSEIYWKNYPTKHKERALKSPYYCGFLGVHRFNPKRKMLENERRYLAEHKIANKIYLDKINTNGKKKITEEQINPNHLFSCLIDFKYSLVILFNILTGRTKGG